VLREARLLRLLVAVLIDGQSPRVSAQQHLDRVALVALRRPQVPEKKEERLLCQVRGLAARAEHPGQLRVKSPPVPIEDLVERAVLVSGAEAGDDPMVAEDLHGATAPAHPATTPNSSSGIHFLSRRRNSGHKSSGGRKRNRA